VNEDVFDGYVTGPVPGTDMSRLICRQCGTPVFAWTVEVPVKDVVRRIRMHEEEMHTEGGVR
jgi:hypothetical protein